MFSILLLSYKISLVLCFIQYKVYIAWSIAPFCKSRHHISVKTTIVLIPIFQNTIAGSFPKRWSFETRQQSRVTCVTNFLQLRLLIKLRSNMKRCRALDAVYKQSWLSHLGLSARRIRRRNDRSTKSRAMEFLFTSSDIISSNLV